MSLEMTIIVIALSMVIGGVWAFATHWRAQRNEARAHLANVLKIAHLREWSDDDREAWLSAGDYKREWSK